jgi:hypothetical protein
MRGAVTLPGSETTSRRKGMHRNLGDLLSPAVAAMAPGRIGKLERATPIRKIGGVGRVRTTVEAPEQGCEEQRRRVWREGTRPGGVVDAEAGPGHSAGLGLSQEAPTRGSKLNGPPKPRMSITLDFRQEPGAGKRAPWKTASRIPVSDRGSRERCFRVNRLTRRRKPHGDQSMAVKRGSGRTCQTRRPARPARYGQGWIA